jgi:RNA polymerase-interacting CarD/CdnL/TRCF family regulator
MDDFEPEVTWIPPSLAALPHDPPANLLVYSAAASEYRSLSTWASSATTSKNTRSMTRRSILLAVAVILAAAPRARGANVESRQRAAKKACLLGDVDKGAEILADLYVETNDETYIYNQGRCFEQNGKNEQAVLRFKEYLRKAKNLRPADRDGVLKKISELQGATGQRQTDAPGPAPEPSSRPSTLPVPQTTPAPAEPPVASAADTLRISQPPPPSEPAASPPIYKRWWFWTGIGAVVAGAVVTAILLGTRSAPQSPACDGLGECVP